jgi:hypothetical protein
MSLNVADCNLIETEALPLCGERETVVVLGVAKVRRDRDKQPIHCKTYFRSLGFQRVVTIDASDWEGCDQIIDLNEPIPDELCNIADLVVDPGTLEHCFDIRRALQNVVEMLTVPGVAFHHSPLNWINHGFFNLSQAFYQDAYNANAFDRIQTWRRAVTDDAAKWWPYDPMRTTMVDRQNKSGEPLKMVMNCMARKTVSRPFCVPMQRRYTEGHWA